MTSHSQQAKSGTTLNFRIDPSLKADFMAATESENRPVSEVLRELISSYLEQKRRRHFEIEARRQSLSIVSSPEEKEVMHWIQDVTDTRDWK